MTSSLIQNMRALMRQHAVDAYLVLSSDPHLSEYLPDHWQARRWLSNFDGSAGDLLITADFAGLWLDSRYWLAAETTLAGGPIQLMRQGAEADTLQWLQHNLPSGTCVAVDGRTLSVAAERKLRRGLQACQIRLNTRLDLPGLLWQDRPAAPSATIFEPPAAFIGSSRQSKLQRLRCCMADQGATHHVISSLDDIAWLFNLRGSDLSYNPVFLAHALISQHSARLFVAEGRIEATLRAQLTLQGIRLEPYEQASTALGELAPEETLLLDPRRVAHGLITDLDPCIKVLEATSPCLLLKSCKEAFEVLRIRETMEQDGAALCEFFAWLEQHLVSHRLTELDIDTHLVEARSRRPGFVSPSFATIAAFNANGAMPHYRATAEQHACLEGDGLLLLDSGGHYFGGTTDITRMVPIGTPSAAQRRDCSLVLKGMIALSRASFPKAIGAPLLDAIARAPLWAEGLDYGHGTGHGVGYFLNVHEGPQRIAYHAPVTGDDAMLAGMVTSIEPGLYRRGQWGVRFENLVLNVPADGSEDSAFLRFETLTLCPIDTRCLDLSLLNQEERDWLDDYHRLVRKRLSPLLEGRALTWLQARTQVVGAATDHRAA